MLGCKTLLPVILILTLISACGVKNSEYERVVQELTNCQTQNKKDSILITHMRDTISRLSYSADQRLLDINKHVSEGEYDMAMLAIYDLNYLFPNSKESNQTSSIVQKIDQLKERKKTEEERIKALGFKAIKTTLSTTIDYNKISFSMPSVSNTFIHDSYDSRYFYNRADRGNTYITTTMTVTSESHDPKIPTLAVYVVNGDNMTLERTMRLEFARWKNYGSYLGNHSDFGNDFSKTSTVRFRLGAEVPVELTKKPYAIVLKKTNGLSRKTNRYDTPSVSYSGSISYPYSLSLEDFTQKNAHYVLIKLANL